MPKHTNRQQVYIILFNQKQFKMQVVNQVLSTNDYSKFKTLQGNRNVNTLHVRRLKESFKEAYLLTPIVINQSYEIIDGQHRFEAAKEMGLPINFIICNDYSLKEVQLLNNNMKNWRKEDYLKAFCDLGYEQYHKFREFMEMFPELNLSSCEIILTNNVSSGQQGLYDKSLKGVFNATGRYYFNYFQEGKLVIPDFDKAVENAEKIMMIKPYYDGFNRSVFIRAMVGIFSLDYYSHAKFLQRLAANPNMMRHCANIGQYKLLIEDIYNYRSRDNVSLRF